MHVPSYGQNIRLKHEKIETNFKLEIKGLNDSFEGSSSVVCHSF